ncbi:MAG: M23 family metallopeptidase [Actinobacteria bacterium]|nr:M23 family metallopeptidase [Actinomycetota bacterium]MCA1807013.1 M23 family metallopeptidase [Actinomycetota bacterium]
MRLKTILWASLWALLTTGLAVSVSFNLLHYFEDPQHQTADTDSEPLESGGVEVEVEPVDTDGDFIFPIHPDDYIMVTSPHGYRVSPLLNVEMKHNGLDVIAPRYAQVLAIADGKVITHWPAPGAPYPGGGTFKGHDVYGGMIIIEHADGIQTLYAHLSTTYITLNQRVTAGDIIGRMGNTGQVAGRSGGHHLHFEVMVDGESVNPLLYVPDPELEVNRLASRN